MLRLCLQLLASVFTFSIRTSETFRLLCLRESRSLLSPFYFPVGFKNFAGLLPIQVLPLLDMSGATCSLLIAFECCKQEMELAAIDIFISALLFGPLLCFGRLKVQFMPAAFG